MKKQLLLSISLIAGCPIFAMDSNQHPAIEQQQDTATRRLISVLMNRITNSTTPAELRDAFYQAGLARYQLGDQNFFALAKVVEAEYERMEGLTNSTNN